MSKLRDSIQATLLKRDNAEDNPWTVYYGLTHSSATQILNKDGSQPYVRQENVSPEMMAYDESINIQTEIFRVTWIPENTADEPNANVDWWISFDDGITKNKVSFINKKTKAKRAFWWIFLKKG